MSLDNQAEFGSKDKRDKSTSDLARPWLTELASADTPARLNIVPSHPQEAESVEPPPGPGLKSSPGRAKSPPPRRPKPRRRDRGWWTGGFLFGFAVGLALSLTYGWLIDPRPQPIRPADLTLADKEVYVRLVAIAFLHNNNNEAQARSRLAKLADPNIQMSLTNLTERYIDQNGDVRDIRALVGLATLIGPPSAKMVVFLSTPTPLPTASPTPPPPATATPNPSPTPVEPTVTATRPASPTPTVTPTRPSSPTLTSTPTDQPSPTATASPSPSPTSSPTVSPTPTPPPDTPTPGPDSPFGLAESVVSCDRANGGLLKIYIRDRLGAGVPGVEIKLRWSGGQDNLFTGFKPEIDSGYADFQMKPGEIYRIELVSLETTGKVPEVTLASRELCPDLTDDVEPGWQVVFEQGIN